MPAWLATTPYQGTSRRSSRDWVDSEQGDQPGDDGPPRLIAATIGRKADVEESCRRACGLPETTPSDRQGDPEQDARPDRQYWAVLDAISPGSIWRYDKNGTREQAPARQCHDRDQHSQPPAHGYSSLSRGH